MFFCSNQLQVDRYSIAEQEQREAQHRQRMERRRMKTDVEKVQAVWTKQRAQREKYRDKRKPRPLQHSGEQGSDDNHYSD
jgi:hypothetical protein